MRKGCRQIGGMLIVVYRNCQSRRIPCGLRTPRGDGSAVATPASPSTSLYLCITPLGWNKNHWTVVLLLFWIDIFLCLILWFSKALIRQWRQTMFEVSFQIFQLKKATAGCSNAYCIAATNRLVSKMKSSVYQIPSSCKHYYYNEGYYFAGRPNRYIGLWTKHTLLLPSWKKQPNKCQL